MKNTILILTLVLTKSYLFAQTNTAYGTLSGGGGTYNVTYGYNTAHNVSGSYNAYVGYNSGGTSATGTGSYNSALGYTSLFSNTSGTSNTAIGYQSLYSNTTGGSNTALGYQALYWNTASSSNTAIGTTAGVNTTGGSNTFVGANSGYSNTSGSSNTLIGAGAGFLNSTSTQNSSLGSLASYHTTTGYSNTAIGYSALYTNSTGANNVAVGNGAGYNALGGSNVFLGFNAGLNETGSNKLYIANSGTNPPLIYGDFSAGNVGLGTITPQVLLDVQSRQAATSTIRVTSNNAPQTASVEASASGNLAFMEGNITPTSAARFGSRNNMDMYLATNNTNRMVVKTSGNVGINTTTPAYQLDVNGIVNATGIYVNGSPISGSGSSVWTTTTSGTSIYYNTGAVGLGTTTPNANYKLDAAGIINATGFSVNGVPSVSSQWTTSGTNINYSTGNVGIGSSNPDYKLTVNGTIHSTEVKVTATVPGPDYVFEKDYKLLSLEEVKTYIEQNKHLPEVPSAKEMETNGLSLSEMNLLLLKKVEELTLHLIDLKRENKILNERIEKIEGRK